MAENVVINGTTYNGVDSVAMPTADGGTAAFYPDAVRYTAQTLTEEQQEQARSNIGAGQPVLEVTITQNEDGSYEADKAAADIVDAHNAGRGVYAAIAIDELPVICYLMSIVSADGMTFAFFSATIPTFDGIVLISVGDGYAQVDRIERQLSLGNLTIKIGTQTVVYDGTANKLLSVSSLPNPFALTFTGAATGDYNGSSAKTVNIPTVPASLKNPYALTINDVSYDGSAAVNLTIEGGSGDTIPDYVRTEAERVAAVVQSRQNANTITAILSSDYHLPNPTHTYYGQILESITHAGQAMSILREQVHRDFEVKLGDILWDAGETQEEALASFRLVHALVSDRGATDELEANGNHDHLQSNATPFTDAQVYANLGIYNKGCVRDSANRVGGYCYRDYEEFKLRVILLNTSEASDGSFALSAAQVAWLGEALAVPTEEGWGSLILSHHPLDWGGSNTAVMQKIKAASGILANLHGHVHTFTQDVITGTSIPRLAIPNVCFYRNNEYGQNGGAENSEGIEFGTGTTYGKVAKSGRDTSFCVMTLDREAGKLYLDAYGAGVDREQDVGSWKVSSYTNLVPTSQAANSTEPYNGTGYKNGYRLSSSSPFESAGSGFVLTGYIPYVVNASGVPGTIYIKGADWNDVSNCRLFFFDSTKATIKGPQINGAGTGNSALSTYFTVESLGESYYKLTPIANSSGNWVGISTVATVTDADYMRLSLVGTGENLIVTLNEPIE